MGNADTVKAIYEAFGRGDVPAILARLADGVEWEYGDRSTDVPWLEPRRGRADVARFFDALGELEIDRFEPKAFLGSGDVVVVLVDLDARVRRTGRRIREEDEVHVWRFAPDGLAKVLETYLEQHLPSAGGRGNGAAPEAVPSAQLALPLASTGEFCPDCSNGLVFQEGCSKCLQCGFSKC